VAARAHQRLLKGETFINRVEQNLPGEYSNLQRAEHKSRREVVLDVMKDGLPRSPMEIQRLVNVTKLDSLLCQMWQSGDLLASKIVNAYTLEQKRGRYKWTPRRMRFYVIAKTSNLETILNVCYSRWNKWLRKNEVVKDKLLFKPYSKNDISQKENVCSKIVNELQASDVALFSEEIASRTKIARDKVANALHYLKINGVVTAKGWFNPDLGRETHFDKGYLWFARIEQYGNRLKKHDLLTGRAQKIYEIIKSNSEFEKRFTPKTELFGGSEGSRNENVMKYLRSIYKDTIDKEIAGETYYYIDGVLTEEEIQSQVEYWQRFKSSKSSVYSLLGRAYEHFFEYAIQVMWNNHDLKVQNMNWRFQISRKDRRPKLNCRFSRLTNPRKLAEFDRIMEFDLAPFSSSVPTRITLIFESRYQQVLTYEDWDRFLQKIADTREYGSVILLRTEQGYPVKVMVPKVNVIPVMVVQHAGKNEKGQSFAQYVHSQGGLVLFASEFEKYLRKKTGKSFTFKSLFKRWFNTEARQKEFAEHLLAFFGLDNKQ